VPRKHLDEATLTALLDGELRGLARLSASLHLRRCARCRAALDAERALDLRARALLARLPRRARALLAALCCVALGGVAARAQQSAPRTPGDSARADSARAQRIAGQVITGTRLTASADERTPVQVDVVTLRAAPRGPAAVADAVARLPGVSMFDDQGTRAQPTINVRGFTASPVVGVPQGLSVFLDGVRVNEPDAQQVNFDLIPVEAVEHAELLRGPSALFGKNTLAGALNLVTARGEATPRLDAEAEAGPFGYRALRGIASGARRGFDGYLLARASTEDGWREETGAVTRILFANVGRRNEADGRDLALTLLWARDSIMQAGSLPESFLAADRRDNYTGGDFFRPHLLHAALRGRRPALGGELRGNLFARRNASEQFNVNVDDPSTRARIRTLAAGGTAELTVPTRVTGRALALTVGGEYTRNAVRYRIYQEANADGQAPDPAECETVGAGGGVGLCENARVNEDDAALYAQGVLSLGPALSLTAALRADYVRVPFEDLREAENGATSTFRRVSPRAGLNYRLGDDVRGYVAGSGGFRAPAALELACADEADPCPLPFALGDDPPLRPVTVWDAETGIDWEPRDGTSLDVVAFDSEVRNEIVYIAADNPTQGFFANVPRSRRAGVEASAALELTRGVRAFASYALVRATYQSTVLLASAREDAGPAEPGDRFPLSPLHRATAGVGLTRLVRGSLLIDGELSASAASGQYLRGDEANEADRLPGFVVANLRLSAEWRHLTLAAHATNLFDRRYATFGIYGVNALNPDRTPRAEAVERFLTPAYPRTVTVTVGVKR